MADGAHTRPITLQEMAQQLDEMQTQQSELKGEIRDKFSEMKSDLLGVLKQALKLPEQAVVTSPSAATQIHGLDGIIASLESSWTKILSKGSWNSQIHIQEVNSSSNTITIHPRPPIKPQQSTNGNDKITAHQLFDQMPNEYQKDLAVISNKEVLSFSHQDDRVWEPGGVPNKMDLWDWPKGESKPLKKKSHQIETSEVFSSLEPSQFDVTTIADAVWIAKHCESSLLQHTSATQNRAPFSPYQNCNDQPYYEREFGKCPEIEFDRESVEIKDEKLQDKQPEEDVKTLIMSENEQSLECVGDESSADDKSSEVIAAETVVKLMHKDLMGNKYFFVDESSGKDIKVLKAQQGFKTQVCSNFDVKAFGFENYGWEYKRQMLILTRSYIVDVLSLDDGVLMTGKRLLTSPGDNQVWEPGGVSIEQGERKWSEKCYERSRVMRLMQRLISVWWKGREFDWCVTSNMGTRILLYWRQLESFWCFVNGKELLNTGQKMQTTPIHEGEKNRLRNIKAGITMMFRELLVCLGIHNMKLEGKVEICFRTRHNLRCLITHIVLETTKLLEICSLMSLQKNADVAILLATMEGLAQKISCGLLCGESKFHLKHKWKSRLIQALSGLQFVVENGVLFTSPDKLLFPNNHKLLHPETEFCAQYNDLEQLRTESQSSPGLDYFAYLIFLWNQALNCGCEAGHISSRIVSVGGVHGLEAQRKRLLVLNEISLLENNNKIDLTIQENWFYTNPMIRGVFHLQRPPELIDLQRNPNSITKVLVQWKEHPPDQFFSGFYGQVLMLSSLRPRMLSRRE